MATGSMDGVSYRPRCARGSVHYLSDGTQQRGGPARRPTPPETTGAASQVSATGSPGDGRGHGAATGSSGGSRDHVAATIGAGEKARPRAASDDNHVWHNEPGDAPGFQAVGRHWWWGSAIER